MYAYSASSGLILASTGLAASTLSLADTSRDAAQAVALAVTLTPGSTLGDDIIAGTIGSDSIEGWDGNDLLYGLESSDSLFGGEGSDVLEGGDGNDFLQGDEGDDSLYGGAGDDTLYGGSGNDEFTTDLGDDSYIGDDGIDTLVLVDVTRPVFIDLSVGRASGADIGNDTLSGIENIWGGDGADTLIGDSGDNLLAGGKSADSMSGGDGDDIYLVDNAGDTVIELAGAGFDRIQSSVAFSLPANVEVLQLVGAVGLTGTGNAGSNALFGGAGADTLDGQSGADT